MSDRPPWSARPPAPPGGPPPYPPGAPASGPPTDPPTDPGTGDPYGPPPDGWGPDSGGPGSGAPGSWGRPGAPDPRNRQVLIALAVLALVAVVLLVWLLAGGARDDDGGPAAAPPLPEPTLEIERRGFTYSIGVGEFTPALDAPGAGTVEPGRHLLTAIVVIRNDTDRPAPALIDSYGAAPQLRVGLAGVPELAPINSLGLPRMVSDCVNDPRNPSVFIRAADRYPGLQPPTCIVKARIGPAAPAPTGADDSTVNPGASSVGLVSTVEIPQTVTAEQASLWLAERTAGDGAVEYLRIP